MYVKHTSNISNQSDGRNQVYIFVFYELDIVFKVKHLLKAKHKTRSMFY